LKDPSGGDNQLSLREIDWEIIMIRIPTHRAPTHPGEMLLEEFLKQADGNQPERIIKCHQSTLSKGKRNN
jgi:hypothetical protein